MKLRKSGKLTFFVVLILILALTFTAFFGIETYYGDNRKIIFKGAKDIRWGIDIQGGVEAVFSPNKEDVKITGEDMDAAKAIIETRLVNENITDYEVYTDSQNHQIIVRFPWEAGESDFDAVATVEKLGTSAVLIFRKGTEKTGEIVLQGAADVKSAYPAIDPETNAPIVGLELTKQGTTKFASATSSMAGQQISIWLSTTTSEVDEKGNPIVEEILLSAPSVNEPITNGQCVISGSDMTAEYVKELSEQINSGKLPFALTVDDSKLQIISPTLALMVRITLPYLAKTESSGISLLVKMLVAISQMPKLQ
jgi:preprotein translocase subunit SecD